MRTNKILKFYSLLFLFLSLFFAGCATNTIWHSAKPLKKNEQITYWGASYAKTNSKDSLKFPESKTFFPLEYSLADALDSNVSARLSFIFPISLSFGIKFPWTQNRSATGFFAAQEIDFGTMNLIQILLNQDKEKSDFNNSDNSEGSFGLFEIKLPTYFSYYPISGMGFTLAPAYILRYYKSENTLGLSKHFSHLLGIHSNIQFGTSAGLCIEFSSFKNFHTKNMEYQGGLALFFKKLNFLKSP